jgi:predicted nuclease of predicted toxin-antitoxin system
VKGFLLDENLPSKLRFTPLLPVQHSKDLGDSVADADLWSYAKANDLVIVTKDADFSDRILVSEPPPRIVHLRFGNLRRNEFHAHLASVWTKVEELLKNHKLVNIYLDRLEAVKTKAEVVEETTQS